MFRAASGHRLLHRSGSSALLCMQVLLSWYTSQRRSYVCYSVVCKRILVGRAAF